MTDDVNGWSRPEAGEGVRRRGLLLGGTALTLGLAGCLATAPTDRPPPDTTDSAPSPPPSGRPTAPPSPTRGASTVTTVPPPGSEPPTAPTVSNLADLRPGIADLEDALGAVLGVAVAVAGADGIPGREDAAGTIRTGPAWSTAKVPLALAALADHPGATTDQLVSRAIRLSDNGAAQQLWDAWPSPEKAAKAVAAVLRAGGDGTTKVPSASQRTGYSVFGQTDWSLALQARFAADLACLPHADAVLEHMRNVADNQRWGVSTADGFADVARKGGWGPDANGTYLVRQLAVAEVDGHRVGITLAARSSGGSFEDGTQDLDRLSHWLGSRLRIRKSGRCPR